MGGIYLKLSFKDYKSKMQGCWMGKNIGGVLGAPFEGKRQVNHVDYYIQDLKGNPPPNDDLDLQLVWLNAVEEYGRGINASLLGEYWLTYIIPDWVEYGAGKNNLRMGLVPPLSGYLDNNYKDSCGCFIRSEIWACLAPGRPELAVRYAYEDAIVDHADDGLYGELFCAAIQSSAFVESNVYKLIEIGLSYIPQDCGVATAAKTAINSYKSGRNWMEARIDVMKAVPGTFGIQSNRIEEFPDDVPAGKPGYDAPSNIGIAIIGWLYGEGDFGKSICIANNCGEDTDCTAATLGAILGIICGIENIPQKWIDPIGDVISTCCINLLNGGISIPKTVTELTERILRVTPFFLGREICDILAGPDGYTIEAQQDVELYCVSGEHYLQGINGGGKPTEPQIEELTKSPYIVRQKFATFNTELDYMGNPYIKINENKKIKLTIFDNKNNQNHQWLTVKWFTPEDIEILPNNECSFFLKTTYKDSFEMEFEINASKLSGSKVELLIDITVNGRHTSGIVKVVLIPRII
jgi:ADP-ribosylglycohydrolase